MRRLLRNRYGRRLPAVALVSLLSIGVPMAVGPISHASAKTQAVSMQVDGITPSAPARTTANRPLRVTLTLTNSTAQAITGVMVDGERGYPITTRSDLQTAISDPVTTPGTGLAIKSVRPVTATIPADSSVQVTFQTTTSILESAGICECTNAVYPLLFTAHRTAGDGSAEQLAATQTFLPVFLDKLPPLKVDWIWPIIDRPHRTTSDTVFQDDELAASVAAGGRLDRALSVVEQVPSTVPLTLLLDPETLDELQVMSTGAYRVVATGSTSASSTAFQRTIAGTGESAAAQWLSRLRAILTARPADEVALTPYADPDVQTLAVRGLRWASTLPAAMVRRVATALGPDVTTRSDLSWPAAPRISPSTVAALTTAGARTVVLDSAAVRTGASSATGPPGVVTLSAPGSDATALLTDATIQKQVATAIASGNSSTTLPALLAELAVRVTSTPTAGRVTVLAAPRYVDASVTDAVATINATSTSTFTSPASLSDVSAAVPTSGSAVTLRGVGDSPVALRDSVVSAIRTVRQSAGTIRSLLTVTRETAAEAEAARSTVSALPVAIQRLQSSAWRTDSGVAPAVSDSFASDVTSFVDKVPAAVFIVKPSTGVYTLASTNSDLPITVKNSLSYPVSVTIGLSTVSGVPGFSAKDIGDQVIAAGSQRTLHVPVTVQRSGRIQVQALLSAPDNAPLGSTLELTVHSTALGRIGVIITIAAGALLVLALLIRAVRWLQRRRRRTKPGATAGNLLGSPA